MFYFVKEVLSTWLIEAALDLLEREAPVETVRELLVLYSWCYLVVCVDDHQVSDLVERSLEALRRAGYMYSL